jgi:ribulose-5-phosphate 4-epimerase/fuculose-1-phosphate aldolase
VINHSERVHKVANPERVVHGTTYVGTMALTETATFNDFKPTHRAAAKTMSTDPIPSLNTEASLNRATGQLPRKRIHHIPWPATKEEHRQWQLEHMAGAFRVFAKLGFADGGSGHISLRGKNATTQSLHLPPVVALGMRLCLLTYTEYCIVDPIDTNTFWINPYGVHFGLLKVSDLVQVNERGDRVGGADMAVNTAGFIIHSQIHQARPEINAACHMHSPYGRAWSTFGKPIEMLNQGELSLIAPVPFPAIV